MRKSSAPDPRSTADCRLDSRYEVVVLSRARTASNPHDSRGERLVLTDISFGGFQTQRGQLLPGQPLIVDIPLLGDRRAQVRWVRGRRAGCRFSEPLTAEELQKLVGSIAINGSYFP